MRTPVAPASRRHLVVLIALAIGVFGAGLLTFAGSVASGAGAAEAVTSTTLRSTAIGRGVATTSSTTSTIPETTESVTTTLNLVSGQLAATTSSSTTVAANAPDDSNKTHRTINWKVWGIAAGLVVVAILMAILTWRYWRRTRPQSSSVVRSGEAFTVGSAMHDDSSASGPPTSQFTPAAAEQPPGAAPYAAPSRGRGASVSSQPSPFLDQLAAEAAAGPGGSVEPATVDLNADPDAPGPLSRSRRRGSRYPAQPPQPDDER